MGNFKEKLIEEFGIEKANYIMLNQQEYVAKVNVLKVEKELSKEFILIKESNKAILKDISNVGDFFNNKTSSFYSSKNDKLIFFNESSEMEFVSAISFSNFKQEVKKDLDSFSELLVYIDTCDVELMVKVETCSEVEELFKLIQ